MIARNALRRIQARIASAASAAASASSPRNLAAVASAAQEASAPPPSFLNQADVQLDRSGPTRKRDPLELRRVLNEDEETRNDLAYSLSYATEDDNSSDFSRNFMDLLTDDIMKEQLEFSKNQLTKGHTERDPLELRRVLNEDEQIRNDLAYSLSYATDDNDSSDFSGNFMNLLTNDIMKEQLEFSKNQLLSNKTKKSGCSAGHKKHADDEPLPRTLDDALRCRNRAIVITEATEPFRVYDVNRAWENLCGYSHVESKGKTLGSLLGGPETDYLATTAMISQLLKGENAGATLTNYTKSGRKFRNRLRCGPLVDTDKSGSTSVTHFVGVLQEVSDEM